MAGRNTIDFNNIFFGRHERYHKIITLAVLLAVIIVIGGYQFFGTQLQSNDNRPAEPAKVVLETLKYQDLLERNPKLSPYTKSAVCREKFGFIYFSPDATRANKTELNILTLDDAVIGIVLSWPANDGWSPYADQPQKSPRSVRGRPIYTQTIYFKDPPTKEDCEKAGG